MDKKEIVKQMKALASLANGGAITKQYAKEKILELQKILDTTYDEHEREIVKELNQLRDKYRYACQNCKDMHNGVMLCAGFDKHFRRPCGAVRRVLKRMNEIYKELEEYGVYF